MFWKSSENSQENNCTKVSFLLWRRCSAVNFSYFLNNLFHTTPPPGEGFWLLIMDILSVRISPLTLSWRRSLSYRNQFIDLLHKSIDWFLYVMDLRQDRFNFVLLLLTLKKYFFIWYKIKAWAIKILSFQYDQHSSNTLHECVHIWSFKSECGKFRQDKLRVRRLFTQWQSWTLLQSITI